MTSISKFENPAEESIIGSLRTTGDTSGEESIIGSLRTTGDISVEEQIQELRDKISNYTPGNENIIDAGSDYKPPDKIRIAPFGVTCCGKSAWINSTFFAFTDTWKQIAREGEWFHMGGETAHLSRYMLTENVTLIDSRGLKDLRSLSVVAVLDTIKGSGEDDVIICPVLMFHNNEIIATEYCREFIVEAVDQITQLYGTYPMVIITFAESKPNSEDLMHNLVTYGFEKASVFAVENYTVANHEREEEKHLELLKILWKCIQRADENHARRHVRRKRKEQERKKEKKGWLSWLFRGWFSWLFE